MLAALAVFLSLLPCCCFGVAALVVLLQVVQLQRCCFGSVSLVGGAASVVWSYCLVRPRWCGLDGAA